MFSVIIPLYNKAEYIGRTIYSVLQQTFEDFEVIVVDDSSTDNSLDIVKSIEDPRLHVFTKPNGGVSAARNFGIAKATHEVLAFLDADDMWEKDYLESMYELISLYPQAGIFASGYLTDFGDRQSYYNHLEGLPKYSLFNDYFEVSFKFGMSVNITSATCVYRKTARSIPMFREGIRRGEDIDVWLRIALKYPVAFYNEPKMRYMAQTSTSLSSHYTNASDEFSYMEWFSYKSGSPFYKKYVMLAIYIFAKSAYRAHDYKACKDILAKTLFSSLSVKPLKRLYLLLSSFFLMKLNLYK